MTAKGKPVLLSKDTHRLASGVGSEHWGGISEKHYNPVARDPALQAIDKRIAQLKTHIDDNLRRCAALYRQGQKERSLRCACVASEGKARLADLLQEYADKSLQAHQAEPAPAVKPSRSKRKPKRYARWAEK